MANDGNIIIKITSEADLSDAQLQMKDLQEQTKRTQKAMEELSATEREDAESIKKLKLSLTEQNKALEENERYYRELRKEKQQEINQNEKSIQSLKKGITTYNALNSASSKMMMRIRELREALMQMEMAGDTSSQAFIDMSVEAAKLQDQMGDTAAQIRILASDTKNLDAMVDIGSGLTGVYTAATSAVALFTDENEALQKAFLKVQAAMSILNGIQQVANTLNKDSAANVVLRTALTKLFTKTKQEETVTEATNTAATTANTAATTAQASATTAATTATKGFTKALLANPIMLVVAALALLVGGLMAAYEWFSESARASREYEKALKALEESEMKLAAQLSNINKEKARILSEIAQKEADYQKEADKNNASEIARAKKSIEFAKEREEALKKALDDELKAQQDNFDKVTQLKKDAEKLTGKEKTEKLAEAEKLYNEALTKQYDIKTQLATIDKERLQLEETLKNKLIEQKKEERDMTISLMKEGSAKQIAEINARYDDEAKAIKEKYGNNTTLIKGLEEKRQKEIQAVRDKSTNEFLKLEDEYNVILAEIASAENPFNKTLDIVEVKAKATASINDIKRQIEDLQAIGGDNSAETIRNLNAEIERIEKETNQTVKKLEQDAFAEKKNIANLELQQEINKNESILQNEKTKTSEKKRLIQETSNMVLQQISNEMAVNDNAYQQGLISYETYLQNKVALEKKYNDEIANTQKAMQDAKQQELAANLQYAQMALQTLGQIADEIFGAIQDKISREMEALDEMYTTDAEEARNNADKKYISEKELENKKLELKRKAAAVEKAQAIFSIGLNTALAIMSAIAQFGPPPSPMGIAGIAMATALGATQLAVALSKPLPQYAKGRKGGAGEYALVGEKGPELMYIPQGASIVPNNKLDRPDTWGDYGIPRLQVPEMPNIDKQIAMQMVLGTMIDYNRLGKAVADNIKIPQQNAVSVNIDKNGISVTSKGETHTYLNKKYSAQWN